MKPFTDLTPIGQARRLRPHAVEVLRGFGITNARLRQLTAATNTVFRVDTAGGERHVLRMTSPKSAHSVDSIHSEIAWVRSIQEETRLSVPSPIALPSGEYVLSLDEPWIPGVWHCTLQSWVPGKQLSERLTAENVALQGELSARLHEHGRSFVPPDDFRTRTFRTLFPYSDPAFANSEPIVLFDRCSAELMPKARIAVFREAHDRIQDLIDALFEDESPHAIHNDLHLWNVLIDRDCPAALDFEDMLVGHPIQDVATALYYYRYNARWDELFGAFRLGYERVREWPEGEPGQLEGLIAARGILLANFVAASQDAAERSMAPDYLARMEERLRHFLVAPVGA